jgi:hypothetical protein
MIKPIGEPYQIERFLGCHRTRRDVGHQRHVLARPETRNQIVELKNKAHTGNLAMRFPASRTGE